MKRYLLAISMSLLTCTHIFASIINAIESDSKNSVLEQQAAFFKNHVLVFFFSSQCLHCVNFAPILKNYAQQHQAHVLPLSFDNQPLDSFPETLPASTEWIAVAFKGEEIRYPALFIANPKTYALYPVSIGALNTDELQERMNLLISKIKIYEEGNSL